MQIDVIASGSGGNAYLINGRLLIECGIPFKELMRKLWERKLTVTVLDGCLISHAHSDHSRAVNQIMFYGVDCWMSSETKDIMLLDDHRAKVFSESQDEYLDVNIGEFKVRAFKAVHDVPCLGFIISIGKERLLYLSDSAYSPYTFPGLTHCLLGCNYSIDILNENIENGIVDQASKSRLLHSHASIETVKSMLEANDLSNVKEIHLIHISTRNGDPKLFKEEIQKLTGKEVYVHA